MIPRRYPTSMEKDTLKPILIRLRPDTRQILDSVAERQRRSRASIIDELIVLHLGQTADTQLRLQRIIGAIR